MLKTQFFFLAPHLLGANFPPCYVLTGHIPPSARLDRSAAGPCHLDHALFRPHPSWPRPPLVPSSQPRSLCCRLGHPSTGCLGAVRPVYTLPGTCVSWSCLCSSWLVRRGHVSPGAAPPDHASPSACPGHSRWDLAIPVTPFLAPAWRRCHPARPRFYWPGPSQRPSRL